ncbi:MAG TPA: SpoIIE family protein phosphatase [Solirubrobacteraceae bacterium]|jgi:PAS domain S-box-containing protein|nr:SpoIIE family protein phosphatase [Solirubrobacteraceae bacterium]
MEDRREQGLVEELQRALAASEHRLAVILDSLAEAVTIRAGDDRLVHANQAALDRLGFQSAEELRQADPHALMGPYETTDEHGQEIRMEDLPSVKLLRGEQPQPLLLRAVHRETGEEQWSLLKATAVRDAGGEIEAAVTIIEDVTQSKRAALRMQFLTEVGDVLASSLDYQQTLRNVAGLAVPQIADWCAVDLFTDEGGREPVAIAHSDPAKLRTAARLRAYEPELLNPEQGLGRVLRTGESQLFTEIPDELLAAAAVDQEHLELLREVGMRTVLIVPLAIGERTIGGLTMVNSDSRRRFDESDLAFAEQIAARAALAVESARLYSARSNVARTLQSSLLPEAIPQIPGWELAALYRPAGRETEVGGDFYDFWALEDEWMMMIGDVTGKGVGAAAVTSLVRHTARAASEFDARPSQVLARVDAALRRRPAVSLCTALCMRISPRGATIAVGGHPLPLRVGGDGVSEVGDHGTLLGALARTRWPEAEIELRPGQTLVLFTDGVTDTVGEGGVRWGAERLQQALAEMSSLPPAEIGGRLLATLDRFQVGAQADDTAVVIMRFSGEPPVGGRIDDLSGVGIRRNG